MRTIRLFAALAGCLVLVGCSSEEHFAPWNGEDIKPNVDHGPGGGRNLQTSDAATAANPKFDTATAFPSSAPPNPGS